MKSKSFCLSLLAVALLPVGRFAQERALTPVVPPPSQTTPAKSAPALLIGSGDLLDVGLYGIPDFKAEVRVNNGGEISLPMLGTVAVDGLSVEQAEKLIELKLV